MAPWLVRMPLASVIAWNSIISVCSCLIISCLLSHVRRISQYQTPPFTSEFVGSILAIESCEKSRSTLCRKSWVFSGCSGFLPQGKLTGWVRINIVRKVITIVVKVNSLIISLTKLLDADWLRGVQLFH